MVVSAETCAVFNDKEALASVFELHEDKYINNIRTKEKNKSFNVFAMLTSTS